MLLDEIYAKIYPLTIIQDRYCGLFSGGNYIAFNCKPGDIPEEIFGEDEAAEDTWANLKDSIVGVGDTVEEAIGDLCCKLNRKVVVKRDEGIVNVILSYLSMTNTTSVSVACIQTLLKFIVDKLVESNKLGQYDFSYQITYETIESAVRSRSQLLDIEGNKIWLQDDKFDVHGVDNAILSAIYDFITRRQSEPVPSVFFTV